MDITESTGKAMLKNLLHTTKDNCGARKRLAFLFCGGLFLAGLIASFAEAAGTNTLSVAATVLSKNNCKFKAQNSTLNFGAIDPGSSADVTKSTSVQFVCNGSAPLAAFALTTDKGLYGTGGGGFRMRHATATSEYLPYSLALNPITGTANKGVTQTLTITGTVSALNYQSAMAGNYADTVVISLNP